MDKHHFPTVEVPIITVFMKQLQNPEMQHQLCNISGFGCTDITEFLLLCTVGEISLLFICTVVRACTNCSPAPPVKGKTQQMRQ